MSNPLLNYLTSQMYEKHLDKGERGPVITISREYGCEGVEISNLLIEVLKTKELSKKNPVEWNVITKDILKSSALELKSGQKQISRILDAKQLSFFNEFIATFTDKDYESDVKIINTIRKTLNAYAERGNILILGRAGYIISENISKSLHIRIVAPMEWRLNKVAEKKEISISDAKNLILERDAKRSDFRDLFKPNKSHNEHFDITLNRKNLTVNEIVDLIIKALEVKKYI